MGGRPQVRVTRSGASKETNPPSVSVVTQKDQKEDDIYSTLRALQSRNRHPKKWLGQVLRWILMFPRALEMGDWAIFYFIEIRCLIVDEP